MPDSQSQVEILLRVASTGQEQLAALQGEIAGLKTGVNESAAAMQAWRVEQGLSSQATIGATNTVGGLGRAIGLTAANFRPATEAQKAASVAMAETAVNAASLERGLIGMTAGITRAIPGTGALGGEIRALGGGAVATAGQVGILNTVLAGVGITGALAFAAALAAIVTKGVEVQKTLQDLGQGVQGTLATDSSFGAAQAKAGGPAAIQQITQSAKDAQVPISELAKAFDQVFPAAARANTSIKGLSDLIAQLISQEDALHIPQSKIITDLEQIFNGSVKNTNQLAQELGITKEQAAAQRESGTTTDFLIQKQQEFAAAHESAGETISRAEQQVQAAFEQLAAAAAKPIIEPVTKALIDMANAMNDPAIQAGASYIISQFEAIIAEIVQVINWCQQVGKAIVNALQAAASFASSSLSKTGSPSAGEAGLAPEGGPLSAADAASLSDRLLGQESLAAQSRKEAQVQELDAVTVSAKTGTSPVVGASGGKGGGGGAKGPSQDQLDQKQISEIQSELNAKTEQYHSLIEQNNAAHKLGAETLGQENAANLQATNSYIAGIDQSISKLQAMKTQVQGVADAQGGANTQEQKQLNNLDQAIAKMQLLKAQAQIANQGNSFFGQLTTQLRTFTDQMQLTGQKVGEFLTGSLNTGINATSTALSGLIFQTGNWRQTFEQAAESIVQNLIKIGLQALVGLALQKAVSTGARADDARTAAAGAYQSAAQIPYIGWIIAPIAAAAAFAATAAFAQGGIVEGSPSGSDNRIARVATGEGIVTSRAVQHYGAQHIHNLNSLSFAGGGVIGGSSSFGGASSSSGTASRPLHVNMFADQGELAQHVLSHPDAQHMVLDIMRKNRFVLKI